ncbi:MAG: FAD-dependent oxidoreductase [Acidimicrobiales bacterium]|jgi:succinate dehydrogenase/fumarate reductase flavoprotein subunit|nr:FAD-dependent oxidoreductase [Acidimicrobiales bacterium]MDP6299021.1 FAD-dependent oxidoreductase [Acidimicrobiales bacterium]HJM27523.1 FAD-dependent oxidoreductase [Acidimicrobiales bacterium]
MDDFNVLVLGSGAAALSAAVSAAGHGAGKVGIFEKAGVLGGTSSMSGGMIWIPRNHHMAEQGIHDSREIALEYLESLSHGRMRREMIETYVDQGPEMVKWFETNTEVIFGIVEDFPDYHPENPGGNRTGGRSLECPLFSFNELGEWADLISQSKQMSPYLLMNETTLGRGAATGIPRGLVKERASENLRGCGQSLIGRLVKSCLNFGIHIETDYEAEELIVNEGVVEGVRFNTASGVDEVKAEKVIIATGGFEWDADLVQNFIRGPLERPVSIETNTGDGLKMAMRAGAALGNMQEAWWVPVIDITDEDENLIPWMVNRERVNPRCIMVNSSGKRFANEASNYNAFGAAFHQLDAGSFSYVNIPAWMVLDQEYLVRYGLCKYRGEGPVPYWLTSAQSLGELADIIGCDGFELEETVHRWNAQVEDLNDTDFNRGKSINDTHWGDGTRTPAATLGPIDKPPFYAVQVRPGALGTKGGPLTDSNAQVLDLNGNVIHGLYAVGNVMASAMGMAYGGAGGTLGPCMVFGFLAGKHAL